MHGEAQQPRIKKIYVSFDLFACVSPYGAWGRRARSQNTSRQPVKADLRKPRGESPKMAPRGPQDGPKKAQDGPKTAPGQAKMAPRRPPMAPRSRKTAAGWPNVVPRWPTMAQKRSQDRPRLTSKASGPHPPRFLDFQRRFPSRVPSGRGRVAGSRVPGPK